MIEQFNFDKTQSEKFLQYFNAALRDPASGMYPGDSHGFFEDNHYITEFAANLPRPDDEKIFVRWRIVQDLNGVIKSIEGQGLNTTAEIEIERFIKEILKDVLAEKIEDFFTRTYFKTISGCNLPGEYWILNFRFAPLFPDDDSAFVNAERIVVIDQNIKAPDKVDAYRIAEEKSLIYSAYLSFILNTNLERPIYNHVWVLVDPEPGKPYQMERKSNQLLDESIPSSMPKKGELCSLASFKGSAYENTMTNDHLICPTETRRIFRNLESTDPDIKASFASACKLYQLGLAFRSTYPTIYLAYLCASIDSITGRHKEKLKGFSEFMRIYYDPNMNELYDFIWGRIRSSHWHAGNLQLGEEAFSRDLTDRWRVLINGNALRLSEVAMRTAILNWLNESINFRN